MMAGIRGKDTQPELLVRRALHATGFRYRLHVRDLPGKPDIVLPRYRAVVFVHGCFWHRHPGCAYATTPATRKDFWKAKLEGNRRRDLENRRRLMELGWRVFIVWECGIRHDPDQLMSQLETALTDTAILTAEFPCVPPVPEED